jgi:hypothetical protein
MSGVKPPLSQYACMAWCSVEGTGEDNLTFTIPTLTFFSHLRLDLPFRLFPSGFPTFYVNIRGPFEKSVNCGQCAAVMQREAVTVMPHCGGRGNVVVV